MRRGQEYQLPDRQVLTSAVGRITAYMRSSIGILIFALVLAALSAVLTIVGPDQVGKIATRMADGLTTGINLAAVAKIGIGLAILYVISSAIWLFPALYHGHGDTEDVLPDAGRPLGQDQPGAAEILQHPTPRAISSAGSPTMSPPCSRG